MPKPSNIYEADNAKFVEERERLRTFELPNTVSIEAIGPIQPHSSFLDIGAGSNTGLGAYVKKHGGAYTALDKNVSFLEQQRNAGATTVQGDVRSLPFEDNSFDVTHARFLVAHLGAEKQKAIRESARVTKPGGRTIFIDFDWAAAHGSDEFNNFRNLLLHGGTLFDAGFGARLEETVGAALPGSDSLVKRHTPAKMFDYQQVLRLREAGAADFGGQGKQTELKLWNELLDQLQRESERSNPPGFYFPDIVIVTVARR